MKSPAADPQREQLYTFERDMLHWWHVAEVPLEDLAQLARRLCRLYRVSSVSVRLMRSRRYAGDYDPLTSIVTLYVRDSKGLTGQNPATLIHEVCHHVAIVKWGAEIEDHGPEFVALLRDALHRERIAHRRMFDSFARGYGIKVARGLLRTPR